MSLGRFPRVGGTLPYTLTMRLFRDTEKQVVWNSIQFVSNNCNHYTNFEGVSLRSKGGQVSARQTTKLSKVRFPIYADEHCSQSFTHLFNPHPTYRQMSVHLAKPFHSGSINFLNKRAPRGSALRKEWPRRGNAPIFFQRCCLQLETKVMRIKLVGCKSNSWNYIQNARFILISYVFHTLFILTSYFIRTLGFQRVLRWAWAPMWGPRAPGPARLRAPRTIWKPKVWNKYEISIENMKQVWVMHSACVPIFHTCFIYIYMSIQIHIIFILLINWRIPTSPLVSTPLRVFMWI